MSERKKKKPNYEEKLKTRRDTQVDVGVERMKAAIPRQTGVFDWLQTQSHTGIPIS